MTEARSRRRGAELERAILDAAWDELRAVGYARFTIEAVANRAATSKPVIYRRWPNRAELVIAAWRRHIPAPEGPPDTGVLRTDLIALFQLVSQCIQGMNSEVIAGVMGETFRHPEIAAVLREQIANSTPLANEIGKIVQRAVKRGELPPVEVPARAARLPLELIRHETFIRGEAALPEESIAELVDDIYLPLLHGLGSRQR